jgi:hypothetical protein
MFYVFFVAAAAAVKKQISLQILARQMFGELRTLARLTVRLSVIISSVALDCF